MIDENEKMVVYLAVVEWGDDMGGMEVLSIHDTDEGASKALKANGYRPSCTFTMFGEIYASKGKTADELPHGYIMEKEVRP
jgi:hypothetical protein